MGLQSFIGGLFNTDASGNMSAVLVSQPAPTGMTVGATTLTMTGSVVAFPNNPCKVMLLGPAGVSYTWGPAATGTQMTMATTGYWIWVPVSNTNQIGVIGASGSCNALFFN